MNTECNRRWLSASIKRQIVIQQIVEVDGVRMYFSFKGTEVFQSAFELFFLFYGFI